MSARQTVATRTLKNGVYKDGLHSGRDATESMQEAAKNLLLVIVALFPIVDPLGGSPFFLALTGQYSREDRKALSWRIAMNSFFLLVRSYFVGTYVLDFFGISLPVPIRQCGRNKLSDALALY